MRIHHLIPSIAVCSAMLILGTAATVEARGDGQDPPVNFDAQTMAEFTAKVEEYVALRQTVMAALPKLSENATPQEIDRHQREFGSRMAKVRTGAKPGDLFSPSMQAVTRRLMERLFQNTQSRRQLRESVMDDNPAGEVRIAVNARYPDAVPLSTMPPEVLKNLPRIPKAVEYRFVGNTLILLDPDAHLVVDFVPTALPR